jgi:alpha-2-macroglobulin
MRIPHLLGCLAVLLLALTIQSYNKKQRSFRTIDPAFGAYIQSYSGGELPSKAAIRVRFNEAIADKTMVGKIVNSSVFSVSPSVEGEAVWEDAQTIALHPKKRLAAATIYAASLNLGRLYPDAPKKLRNFEFDFAVRPQTMQLYVEGLHTPDLQNLSQQTLRGSLETSEKADESAVERCLKADLSEGSVSVVWKHSEDHRTHYFTINNIVRGSTDQTLTLHANGRPIDCTDEDERSFLIAAQNSFKVVAMERMPDNNGVNITFSDPLLTAQNMEGLITRNGTSFVTTIKGNQAMAYTTEPLGKIAKITANIGIKNINNKALTAPVEMEISFADTKPAVGLTGKGTIMPTHEGLLFPFEAVNLKAVDVEIFKVYQSNMLSFLDDNTMDGQGYQMRNLGHVVIQKRIELKNVHTTGKNGKWTTYALDLKPLIATDAGAMYQVRLGFKKAYSMYKCDYEDSDNMIKVEHLSEPDEYGEVGSILDDYYYGNDEVNDKDPCTDDYYGSRNVVNRNVIASDLGIIFKRGNNGSVNVAVANIGTTAPMAGVQVELFDRAKQSLGTMTTNSEGLAQMNGTKRQPTFLVASHQKQRGYLNIREGYSLSVSTFSADGTTHYRGLNGYIYGDRGVWRPGDSLYLSFVLQDKSGKEAVHPVTMEIFDPQGNLQQTITRVTNVHGIYDFRTATPSFAPTGTWQAVARVGGTSFDKNLKIETVKPNRLKLKLDFGAEELVAADSLRTAKLSVMWLHGAPGNKLRAKVEMNLQPIKTKFKGYETYNFDNLKRFANEPQTIYEGMVDENGQAEFKTHFLATGAPGKLKANLTLRGFERGGDASFSNMTLNYSPYSAYIGVKTLSQNEQPYFKLNAFNTIEAVALNEQGAPVAGHHLSVEVYRLEWKWWWDNADNDGAIDEYNTGTDVQSVLSQNAVSGANGKCGIAFKPTEWGRYLVKIRDAESGHATALVVYTEYRGELAENEEQANILQFTADKTAYKVGETVTLSVPSTAKGNILVSIENGNSVVKQFWANPTNGKTAIRFVASADMSPNIYAHITYLQPHAQLSNQLPVRMYGLLPITVDNPDAQLQPIVEAVDSVRPESNLTLKIREKSSKAMAYTIDIVDDGLLDLTNFKTPNPYSTFYEREALGVTTWDLYDYILGGITGSIESVLSIGGDEALRKRQTKAHRFKPVVIHLGPFYLKNGVATHTVRIPNYVGSVRAMVVASSENTAFGSGEKTIKVLKPLMVLPSAPRVVSSGETIDVPVSVFAMTKEMKDVKISITTNDKFLPKGETTQNLHFERIGDEIITFGLTAKNAIGIGTITVTAQSGSETASETIEVDIRNPNPIATEVLERTLKAGETAEFPYQLQGVLGTNQGVLELSTIPPINFASRMAYILEYPHGCLEQTTSQAFIQLAAAKVLNLDAAAKLRVESNIKSIVETLGARFQAADGGMQYWSGNQTSDDWGTSYAMHFLVEAQLAGYTLPPATLARLVAFQQKAARFWQPIAHQGNYTSAYDEYSHDNAHLAQAYRLYTLALAQQPEVGAMNRLRENPTIGATAKWRLAAAYSAMGKTESAQQIVAGLSRTVKPYTELSNTYGSDTRDEAMILETLVAINDHTNAAAIVKNIAKKLSSKDWYSTQTTAYSLIALSKYLANNAGSAPIQCTYSINGAAANEVLNTKALMNFPFAMENAAKTTVSITNRSKGVLFVRIILKGQPPVTRNGLNSADFAQAIAKAKAAAKIDSVRQKAFQSIAKYTNTGGSSLANILKKPDYGNGKAMNIAVRYRSTAGDELNPNVLEQGTDFVAEVTVYNTGLRGDFKELSLAQIFPSGWEITNSRLVSVLSSTAQNSATPDHQDIRDDRVYTYFDLPANTAQTYRIQLNASYTGEFYLPHTRCEAMYDSSISAEKTGGWVAVVARQAAVASR